MRKAFITVAAFLLAANAHATEYKVGALSIESPWARATASARVSGGVYMTIENGGDVTDRLVSVACDGAQVAEVHETTVAGGVMRMSFIESVEILPGGRVEFAPGGRHVMLAGLAEALTQGNTMDCTIAFQRAGAAAIVVQILAAGAMAPAR